MRIRTLYSSVVSDVGFCRQLEVATSAFMYMASVSMLMFNGDEMSTLTKEVRDKLVYPVNDPINRLSRACANMTTHHAAERYHKTLWEKIKHKFSAT